MAARTVVGTLKMVIPAGKATPQPPVGSALGQRGLNIMQFCKEFNERTAGYLPEVPVPVVITAYKDKSFNFVTKTPPVSYFLRKAAGIGKGSSLPGTDVAGSVGLRAVYEIAKVKQVDQPHVPLQSIAKSVVGTAKSMGLQVVRE
mmetsp:Transcript_2520/g.8338  ORF Transcript_2520/g.8338 Transcript_2520/m.8338 type:complete len:145 (+) Transcript_2520:29-463(+)